MISEGSLNSRKEAKLITTAVTARAQVQRMLGNRKMYGTFH